MKDVWKMIFPHFSTNFVLSAVDHDAIALAAEFQDPVARSIADVDGVILQGSVQRFKGRFGRKKYPFLMGKSR